MYAIGSNTEWTECFCLALGIVIGQCKPIEPGAISILTAKHTWNNFEDPRLIEDTKYESYVFAVLDNNIF